MRFTERLVKHAAEARGTMFKIVDGKTMDERVDGYVLLTPDEAVRITELMEAALAVVHDAEVGGGDYEHLLIPELKAKLKVLEPA